MDKRFQNEVLASIADDYEPLEQVLEHLRRFTPEMDASIHNISQALENLLKHGLARAYVLSPHPPHVTEVPFDGSKLDELYFYVTPQGKQVVEQDSKLETGNSNFEVS